MQLLFSALLDFQLPNRRQTMADYPDKRHLISVIRQPRASNAHLFISRRYDREGKGRSYSGLGTRKGDYQEVEWIEA